MIKAERISNGAIAVYLRCCDDPTTDYPHTFYHMQVVEQADGTNQIVHGLDQQTVDAKLLAVASENVAPLHDAMQAAHAYLQSLVEEPEPPKTTMALKD